MELLYCVGDFEVIIWLLEHLVCPTLGDLDLNAWEEIEEITVPLSVSLCPDFICP